MRFFHLTIVVHRISYLHDYLTWNFDVWALIQRVDVLMNVDEKPREMTPQCLNIIRSNRFLAGRWLGLRSSQAEFTIRCLNY